MNGSFDAIIRQCDQVARAVSQIAQQDAALRVDLDLIARVVDQVFRARDQFQRVIHATLGPFGCRLLLGHPREAEQDPPIRDIPAEVRRPERTLPPPRSPHRVPAMFKQAILRAIPADGGWVQGRQLCETAGYYHGGKNLQHLAEMAKAGGPLESHKRKGYRMRRG